MSRLANRLKRLEGQLARVRQDIEADADCAEVIPQFLAVRGALGSAFEAYVAGSIDQCVDTNDRERTKRLIAHLTKR